MSVVLTLASICLPSANVIAREIDGTLVVVPLALDPGVGDGDPVALNDVGRVIWRSLDGRRTLTGVVDILAAEFGVPRSTLEADVLAFAVEAAGRGALVAGE